MKLLIVGVQLQPKRCMFWKKILMHVMIIQSKYSSKIAIEKPSLLKFFCMKIWMRNRYLVRCWFRQESFVWCCKDGTLFAYQDCGSIIQSIISAFSGCIKIETVIIIFQWWLYLFLALVKNIRGIGLRICSANALFWQGNPFLNAAQ